MLEHGEGGGKMERRLLFLLREVTTEEDWDKYFTIRGSDDSFEWYAGWPQLESLLTAQLSFPSKEQLDATGASPMPTKQAADVRILVPGCGNSKLSENLYDVGFKNITNVDFSKVVISHMMRRNVRERPEMKWRVMDMARLKFENETFDAIVDKGGLDSIEFTRGGNPYLSEVKRILKAGGKYVCLTLAEMDVLDVLFTMFRFGWKMSFYAICEEPSSTDAKLLTFMVVAEKDTSTDDTHNISLFLDKFADKYNVPQAHGIRQALAKEQEIRLKYIVDSDVLYSLEDLLSGAKGKISELQPGRRAKLVLGEPKVTRFIYNGVLCDAKQDSEPKFLFDYGVLLVPKKRTRNPIFTSEVGQWHVVVGSRSARLLMILLDSSNSNVSMECIEKDLSHVVKSLAPGKVDDTVEIPFFNAGDGIKQRDIVHQVTSTLTGAIVVEDVIYQEMDDGDDDDTKGCTFRRLIFKRTENLVQSEALLTIEGLDDMSSDVKKDKEQEAPKPKKKGKQRESNSPDTVSVLAMEIVREHLANPYHSAIISGILLISSHLELSLAKNLVKTVIIGLGGGILPMYMKSFLPSLKIEVVELDHEVLRIAKEYFGFRKDESLKVRIRNGIGFVREKAASSEADDKVDILILDVDAPNPISGLACPNPDYMEPSFLVTVKSSLSKHGLFIMNLISRSCGLKKELYSRMKMVFGCTFSIQLEKDISEVVFALKTDSPITNEELCKAREVLEQSQKVMELAQSMAPLRII